MVPPRPCLDQAVPPNWMTKQGGDWSERLPRGKWQLWKSYTPLWQRLVTVCMWQQYPKHSTSPVYKMQRSCGKKEAITQKSPPRVLSEVCKKRKRKKSHSRDSEATWQKVLWSDDTKMELYGKNCKMLRLVQTQHSTSLKEHHPYCEAWWWQHHVMMMFLISRDWGTCQDRRENGRSKIQKNPRGKPAALCRKAEIGTEVHLSAWQWPKAHSQSYTG